MLVGKLSQTVSVMAVLMHDQPCKWPRTSPGPGSSSPRRLSKNSPSKFISPCHQMACGFQA